MSASETDLILLSESGNSTNNTVTASSKGKLSFKPGKNKRIFEALFDICPLDHSFMICKICPNTSNKKRKKIGLGYSNALSHLKLHPDYNQIIEDVSIDYNGNIHIQRMIVSGGATQVYSWLDWVITDNYPFEFLKKQTTKKYSNLRPMCIPTFLKYMNRLTVLVEQKISKILGPKFGVMIDGWDAKAFSVTGIFANNYSSTDTDDRFILLAASPMYDEESYTAATHAVFITETMVLYGKDQTAIQYLVADNTETMPATARALRVPFIGCASHRLNLSIDMYVRSNFQVLIEKIASNMTALRLKKNRGKLLRMGTKLSPLIRSHKWNSMFKMVQRYKRFITDKIFDDWEEMELQFEDIEKLDQMIKFLGECQIASLQTQKVLYILIEVSCTMLDVRIVFDALLEAFPTMTHIGAGHSIVSNPKFENGLVSVQRG